MTTIYLTTGLPASGKSTWAKALVEARAGQLMRVNLDDIREMLGFGHTGPLEWSKELEQTALKVQDQAILSAVKLGKDVVVDNTHLNKNIPTRIKKLFDGDVQFIIKDYTTVPVDECIRRDFQRALEHKRSVGAEVIKNMARQLQKAWRLTDEFMNDTVLSPPLEYDPDLPWCVVIDTDGTTAHHNRSPYDYARCPTDTADPNISKLVQILDMTVPIIGMSGRPDTWEDATVQWYGDNMIPFDEFYMREAGDSRNDADVKQEMVDKYIRGRYNVLIWLDDRDRVVRRLRKLGIKVGQVAEGDF